MESERRNRADDNDDAPSPKRAHLDAPATGSSSPPLVPESLTDKLMAAFLMINNAISSRIEKQLWVGPSARSLLTFLAAKVAVSDYDAHSPALSPGPRVDRLWRRLLQRPRLYDAVCRRIGATQVIGYNPEEARNPSPASADRVLAGLRVMDRLHVEEFYGSGLPEPVVLPPKAIRLSIMNSLGQTFIAYVHPIHTVRQLKAALGAESIYNDERCGDRMDDDKIIAAYNIKDGDKLLIHP